MQAADVAFRRRMLATARCRLAQVCRAAALPSAQAALASYLESTIYNSQEHRSLASCAPARCTRTSSTGAEVQATYIRVVEDRVGPLSSSPIVPDTAPLVVIISGPSGVGKDAVIKSLRDARPELAFVVTATSRPKRPGEVDGQDYFFVSKDQFERWLQQDELLEHALVYGEYKGIPRSQVERALENDSDVVLRIDVQGAKTIRRMMPEAVSVFLVANSEAELVERLIARKTEPVESMLVRIQTARNECSHIDHFDYVVVNRDGRLEETVAAISAVIDAEKLRVKRRRGSRTLQ